MNSNTGGNRSNHIRQGQGYDPKSKNVTIEANMKMLKLSRTRQLGKVLSCFETYKLNPEFRPSLVTFNVLIGACVRCGDITKACQFFAELKRRSKQDNRFNPDIISFTTLLKGFCCAGWMVAASKLLDQMTSREVGINPNIRTVSMYLRGCLWTGDVHRTIALLQRTRGWWIQLDSISLEYAVRVLAMSIHIHEAEEAIREFCNFALKRTDKTMATYKKGGGLAAKGAFRGISPVTYLALANAHAALGDWRQSIRDARTAEFAASAAEEAAIVRAKAVVKRMEENAQKASEATRGNYNSKFKDTKKSNIEEDNDSEEEEVDSEDEEAWKTHGFTSLHQFLVAKNAQLKDDARALQEFAKFMGKVSKNSIIGTHPSWTVVAEETSAAAGPGERAVDRKDALVAMTTTGKTTKISKPVSVTGSNPNARKVHLMFDASDDESSSSSDDDDDATHQNNIKPIKKLHTTFDSSSSDEDDDAAGGVSRLKISFEDLLKRTLLFPPVVGQDDAPSIAASVKDAKADPSHIANLLANRVLATLGGEAVLRKKNKGLAMSQVMSEEQEQELLVKEKQNLKSFYSSLFSLNNDSSSLSTEPRLNPSLLFRPSNPLTTQRSERPIFLEACAGWGEWIAQKARDTPEADFIACELRHDRCHQILMRAYTNQLDNLAIVRGDVRHFMSHHAPVEGWLDGIFVLFPEPPGRRDTDLDDPFSSSGDHLTGEKSMSLLISALKYNSELIICSDEAAVSRQVSGLIQTRFGIQAELVSSGESDGDMTAASKLGVFNGVSFFDKLWATRQKGNRFVIRIRRLKENEKPVHSASDALKILKKARRAVQEALDEAARKVGPLVERWQRQSEKRSERKRKHQEEEDEMEENAKRRKIEPRKEPTDAKYGFKEKDSYVNKYSNNNTSNYSNPSSITTPATTAQSSEPINHNNPAIIAGVKGALTVFGNESDSDDDAKPNNTKDDNKQSYPNNISKQSNSNTDISKYRTNKNHELHSQNAKSEQKQSFFKSKNNFSQNQQQRGGFRR